MPLEMNKEISNGAHIDGLGGQYEWWYFDFVDEKGGSINLVLHATDIFGINAESYYSLSFLLGNGVKGYLRGAKTGFGINKNQKYIDTDGQLIIERADSIEFNLPFENNILLIGKIKKDIPVDQVDRSVLYETKHGFGIWYPSVLSGKFDIQLKIDGKTELLSGYAYHDHQWGNLPIQRYVSDWVWGHFCKNDVGIVFFKIKTNTGDIINRYYCSNSGESLGGTGNIDVNLLQKLTNSSNPELLNLGLNVNFEEISFSYHIEPSKIMRKRTKENVENKIFTYLRWGTDCVINGKKMSGVTEYMRFR
jgi:hypothetical protein